MEYITPEEIARVVVQEIRGANTGNDNDCLPGCGNGVVDAGETCDTAITTGTNSAAVPLKKP